MDNLAPILLFTYNRPDHTKKTLTALANNKLANQSTLYIFCDGPKTNATSATLAKIELVRNVVRKKKWCKEVKIIERTKNWGLAKSIIEGVTKVVNEYGKVIVLEDDLITAQGFLEYMNQALTIYSESQNVISIHGYINPINDLSETFFLKGADCWGWATWKNSWSLLEKDGQLLLKEIQERRIEYEFNFQGVHPFVEMLKLQIAGKNDSWAIRWYATAFLNNKLTLHPRKSLVKNIGFDGSGTHGGGVKSNKENKFDSTTFINVNQVPTKESISDKNKIIIWLNNQKKQKQKNFFFSIKYWLNKLNI